MVDPSDSLGAEERARAALDPSVYDYYAGGSGNETTLAANVSAWDRIAVRPRVLRDVAAVTTRTTVLGTPVNTPICVAPTAFQALAHPEAETATARAARETGSLLVLSTRTSRPVEEVAAALGPTPWWFQVYVMRKRALTRELVERAVAGGARALALTADTPYLPRGRRDRNPSLKTEPEAEQAPDLTFDDIGWLREISGLPVVVKGVLRGDDATACAAAGAAAVWVSNHGGRQLDGAVATADALPEVAEAAAAAGLETYVDGGIRRGVDVLRALALGARAAFIGRPAVWGLAAGGADGVRTELLALVGDLESAMGLAGARSIPEITSDLVWHPPAAGIR
jgi:4-hydroxymandelate oxidase